jgi:hypothetical protein
MDSQKKLLYQYVGIKIEENDAVEPNPVNPGVKFLRKQESITIQIQDSMSSTELRKESIKYDLFFFLTLRKIDLC